MLGEMAGIWFPERVAINSSSSEPLKWEYQLYSSAPLSPAPRGITSHLMLLRECLLPLLPQKTSTINSSSQNRISGYSSCRSFTKQLSRETPALLSVAPLHLHRITVEDYSDIIFRYETTKNMFPQSTLTAEPHGQLLNPLSNHSDRGRDFQCL